jgi:hypothetical protein
MRNMNVFDVKTLRAKGGIDKETGYKLDGDYFGLPWPCFGNPEMKHPGSPNLYDTTRHVMDGGGNFRANFGVEREGENLLAADGSHSKGAELTTGYPEFDHLLLKKLGWWTDLTEAEQKAAEGKNWKTDPSGGIIRVAMQVHGCHPFGNAKARAVVWNFPDPIPQHREALYSNRPELIAKYPTHDDKKAFWRLPTLFKTVQDKNRDIGKTFPLIMTSGRLVEYEGGGEETRSEPVAGRAAAGDVRRDQPQGGERPWHSQRRLCLGQDATDGCAAGIQGAAREGPRHRARRFGDGVPALPLFGPLGWHRPFAVVSRRRQAGRPWRGGQHRHNVRLRQRDDDARDQDDGLPD